MPPRNQVLGVLAGRQAVDSLAEPPVPLCLPFCHELFVEPPGERLMKPLPICPRLEQDRKAVWGPL